MNDDGDKRTFNWLTPRIQKSMRKLGEMFAELQAEAPEIEKQIDALDQDIAKALREDDDESPLGRRIAYRTTLWAQSGWFPSAWETPLSLISQTAELLRTNRNSEVENQIASHFEVNATRFVDNIIKSNPSRERILRDALHAHANGLYSLSIPVFLIQADGIASSFFGFDSIYTVSQNNFSLIRKKFDAQSDQFRIRYFQFLVGTLTPLNASKNRRKLYLNPFNRHLVIHGESTDYPSKINSLRAISWIQFVSEIVNEELP